MLPELKMKGALIMSKATEEQRQLWILRIRDFEDSGLCLSEWCREKNIPISTMGYWKRKLKKEESAADAPCWLKIDTPQSSSPVSRLHIPVETATGTGVIALKYAGFAIELPACCSSQQVFEMLQVLKTL